jgi:RNA polymerase sigma-70 factor (ECF subfamily)
MGENEAILLQRFSTRADAEAFAELVRRYVRMVYSASWRVLKDEGDAADVTQETFFELTRQAGRISGSLGSWLHQVATRKSIDLVRRSAHRRHREQRYAQTRSEAIHTWHDLSGYVDEALDNLDESTKSLLLEHFLAGKTTSEIARDRGVSQATVSRRVNDGLEQLRGALRRQGLLVAAGALGAMLMENATQAVPATVLAELSKMAMIGTGGAAAALGGKAAVVVSAGTVKAVFAATTILVSASVIVYVHCSNRPDLPAQPSVSAETVRQPPPGNSVGSSYTLSRASTAGEPRPEADSSPVAALPQAEQAQTQELILPPVEPLPEAEYRGGISVGDPFSGVPTADLRTPEAVIYSFLTLIDQGASDQLGECLAEGSEVAMDSLYPRYLGQPIRLVEVKDDGDTAQVLWEATAHTPFSHKGKDRLPGEFAPLCSRLVRTGDAWKLVKLDE